MKSVFIGINIIGILIWVLLIGSGFYLRHKSKKLNDEKIKEKSDLLTTIGCVFWLTLALVLSVIRVVGGF